MDKSRHLERTQEARRRIVADLPTDRRRLKSHVSNELKEALQAEHKATLDEVIEMLEEGMEAAWMDSTPRGLSDSFYDGYRLGHSHVRDLFRSLKAKQ